MGQFHYGEKLIADFDDRLLAHLEVVITAKLRRGEAFTFSWRDDARVGDGRTTVWVHPSTEIVYKYNGGRMASINRAWIETLMQSAHSPSGLRILQEPPESSNGEHL